ncbi:molybdate ABC transporter substrate-binding protein [Macrococcus equi]|uniref:molybdate ABC transporter substrate-binding protein n=1 Tax=Macrococcus equi TaxID=3395462 RepID=UPI0039BEAA37
MRKILLLVLICIIMSGCGEQSATNKNSHEKVIITVSAAASLKNALSEVEKEYEKKHNHVDIKFNYGASGALARQIISGAPVDIFFSAAEDKTNGLVQHKVVDKQDVTSLLKNHLVLISNKKLSSVNDLQDKKIEKIALGNPETVPAGMYSKQVLDQSKLYQKVKSKIVQTKDVRQVLTYVETGNTEAGIVYTSDLHSDNNIKYKIRIDDKLHDTITYPIAKIKTTKHKQETDELYQYLISKQCKKIYQSYGFDIK